RESAWTPLRIKTFRVLWLAQLGSMIGTWMQTVGAQWLLVEEGGAPALVAAVQVAAMLPALVLALPAGALADILDRRRMLIGVQVFQACVAVALTALTVADRMSPALLLTFTFLLGCGITLTLPAYQALIQEIVPRAQVRSAAALGGVAVNGARAVGPALAGLIIAQVGAGAVFALNVVSYLALILVLARLRRPKQPEVEIPERFTSAIRAGQRYVRHSPVVRRMLLRVALFVLPGAALWALLPLVASRLLGAGPTGYGVLLAALGAGAVVGADLLPRANRRLSPNRLLLIAGAAFTASLVACVLVRNLVVLAVLLIPAGTAWLWSLMTVTGALQLFLPAWVRARGLSMFNIVFAGGQAIGAFLWGLLAQLWGLQPTFLAAAAVMALGTATVLVWPLHNVAGIGRELAVLPDPVLAEEPDPEHGPVLVTLTYTVEDGQSPAFLDAMAKVRRSRLRTGARSCELYQDGADPSQFMLVSEYETWGEHLRQHTGRLTVFDQQLYEAATALAAGPPEVRHMLVPADRS
ncbi:MAG TPA: MFS transporter, partial [Pseudonocardiaceae bacterium]